MLIVVYVAKRSIYSVDIVNAGMFNISARLISSIMMVGGSLIPRNSFGGEKSR